MLIEVVHSCLVLEQPESACLKGSSVKSLKFHTPGKTFLVHKLAISYLNKTLTAPVEAIFVLAGPAA